MPRLPILMYHSISMPESAIPQNLRDLCIPPDIFSEQMRCLHEMGYRAVSLREGLQIFSSPSGRPSKIVVVTFDDGYEDNLTQALPVLLHYHFSATCFFVVKKPGADDFDQWPHGTRRLMTTDQIREWHSSGMEVGSHTLTHPRLTSLERPSCAHEIVESRKLLSELVGEAITSFAYPYGLYDTRIGKLVQEAGYQAAVTVEPRAAYQGDSVYRLPRIGIIPRHQLWLFKTKITTPLLDLKVVCLDPVRRRFQQVFR